MVPETLHGFLLTNFTTDVIFTRRSKQGVTTLAAHALCAQVAYWTQMFFLLRIETYKLMTGKYDHAIVNFMPKQHDNTLVTVQVYLLETESREEPT